MNYEHALKFLLDLVRALCFEKFIYRKMKMSIPMPSKSEKIIGLSFFSYPEIN